MRVSICSIGIAFLALSAAAIVEGQDAADKYLLLAAERTTTMQREIDDAAAKGFRVFGASGDENRNAAEGDHPGVERRLHANCGGQNRRAHRDSRTPRTVIACALPDMIDP